MYNWDGAFLPLSKSTDKGIISVRRMDNGQVQDEGGSLIDEDFADELDQLITVTVEYTFKGGGTYTADIDLDTYKAWKKSGFSTSYYNDNIRID